MKVPKPLLTTLLLLVFSCKTVHVFRPAQPIELVDRGGGALEQYTQVVSGKKNFVVQITGDVNLFVGDGISEGLLPSLQHMENTFEQLLHEAGLRLSESELAEKGKELITQLQSEILDKIARKRQFSDTEKYEINREVTKVVELQNELLKDYTSVEWDAAINWKQLPGTWQSALRKTYQVNFSLDMPFDPKEMLQQLTKTDMLVLIREQSPECGRSGWASSSDDYVNRQLRSLQGLKYLPFLEELYLCGHQLQGLAALRQTPQLKAFGVSCSGLASLEGVRQLTVLEALDCSGNRLRSLRGIEELYYLETLNCHDNPLSDIESLLQLLDGPNKLLTVTISPQYLESSEIRRLKRRLHYDASKSTASQYVFTKKKPGRYKI